MWVSCQMVLPTLFRVVGQRGINPSIASLIMSLESVMGAVFGVLFLKEVLYGSKRSYRPVLMLLLLCS